MPNAKKYSLKIYSHIFVCKMSYNEIGYGCQNISVRRRLVRLRQVDILNAKMMMLLRLISLFQTAINVTV